jgi:putative membrane protein
VQPAGERASASAAASRHARGRPCPHLANVHHLWYHYLVMIRKFILRWLVNFLGLWAAAELMSGSISYDDRLWVLVVAALIFSIVNALIRPLVIILSLPAIVLTLGLFTLVVNAFMLYLVTLLYPAFAISSFWTAVLAAVIIWIVNYLLTDLLEFNREKSV